MIASLLFTSFAASKFKSDVKRWRLLADVMVDIGLTLECAAVQVPSSFFIPMISLGNVCKAICGVAAGACGGAINLYWAKGSDISDINAKFGAQNTVSGGIGLVVAALFARSVSDLDLRHLWALYGALTLIHIFANMRCMRLIAFDSFNTIRLRMVVRDFLSSPTNLSADSPDKIARREPLFFLPTRLSLTSRVPIRFGVSFNEFSSATDFSEEDLQSMLEGRPFYLVGIGSVRFGQYPKVYVVLSGDASGRAQLKAYFHALLLARVLGQAGVATRMMSTESRRLVERGVQQQLNQAWGSFQIECRRAGWDLDTSELRSNGFEIDQLEESRDE
jgi:hypothetical protein